ncbi:MAG: glutamate-1-semialdehyde 2,1-aminomutase [Gammaproteobacteria bacterium]|nr:glutamate-1-semialdehyde 2,1-aminomutase [Gammaproteobacteria bacterium]
MPVPGSADLFRRATAVSPGGVHSPVRAFGHVGGSPLFIHSADGARITDTDGKTYTDYCMAFGPLILGHRHPHVLAAAQAALDDGWSYGAAEPWSLQLAELLCDRIEGVDKVRFVNSGTEAVMSALRLARAATGRERIVKFAGCYHGHTDSMLINAGSGMAGIPASAGITRGVATETLVLPLDDTAAAEAVFAEHGHEIAALIIEPLPANNGLLPQRIEFLSLLASLCQTHGALLIFDEVISGFRCGFDGMTGTLRAKGADLQPDIVTWGKIIGGGFPVGAFAARDELMNHIAPSGDVYQAGTLSANPLAMRAGLATLQTLLDDDLYTALDELGARLEAGIATIAGLNMARQGSIFWLTPESTPARDEAAVTAQHRDVYPALFGTLLQQGIYLPPSPYEVCFLSAAHTAADIDKLIAALRVAV